MQYPKEFIEKAKRIYPNWTKLHELLDKGSPFVHTLLYESRPDKSVSFDRVLNAKSLEELQQHVREEQEKASLYLEWTSVYDQCRKANNANRLKEIQDAHNRGESLTARTQVTEKGYHNQH
jgi:hypothetical protein